MAGTPATAKLVGLESMDTRTQQAAAARAEAAQAVVMAEATAMAKIQCQKDWVVEAKETAYMVEMGRMVGLVGSSEALAVSVATMEVARAAVVVVVEATVAACWEVCEEQVVMVVMTVGLLAAAVKLAKAVGTAVQLGAQRVERACSAVGQVVVVADSLGEQTQGSHLVRAAPSRSGRPMSSSRRMRHHARLGSDESPHAVPRCWHCIRLGLSPRRAVLTRCSIYGLQALSQSVAHEPAHVARRRCGQMKGHGHHRSPRVRCVLHMWRRAHPPQVTLH